MRKNTPEPLPPSDVTLAGQTVGLCPLGLMLSAHRNIQWCNQRFAHMFGYVPVDLVGANLAILYPSSDEFQRIGERGRKAMSARGEYQDERLMRRKDGLLQWFRVHGRTLDLADPFGNASWVFEPLATGGDANRLTPREREVLAGMAQGQTAKEAAKALGISPRTVEKLRAGMRERFGVRNAAELMSRLGGLPT